LTLLVLFGRQLGGRKKYCDIDSFTFIVGLQSVISSGLKIKYKMFNNMAKSSKVCLISVLERSLSKLSSILYCFEKKKNCFANLRVIERLFGFGVSAKLLFLYSGKNSRKVPESRQSAFWQLFSVPSFGYWILLFNHL